jgi:flagellar biosynthesis protein FliP
MTIRTVLQLLAILAVTGGGAAQAASTAASTALQGLSRAANPGNGPTLGLPLQIALGMTLLTLLPALIMCVTPFLRITIVLHFLRQALGTQTAPSNQVLTGMALFLSLLIVQPMFSEMYAHAWEPLEKGEISASQAFDQGSMPLRRFLLRFAREPDIRLFVEISKEPAPHNPADISLKVLIPAYILSELKAGFQIGAVLFLPFLVIDIAVASVTLSIGMMQLPPAMVSAPFKILLFVLVDGWNLVIGSLMKSFLQQ